MKRISFKLTGRLTRRRFYRRMMRKGILSTGVALAVAALASGCSTCRTSSGVEASPVAITSSSLALKSKWGIEVTSLRLSAKGYMIDFRYRVLDPIKAATLGDRRYEPCMIDQATGIRLKVPRTPKLGPLRQSATRLETGKIYFALFANAGRVVKSGAKVTVVIGNFRVENLVVQ